MSQTIAARKGTLNPSQHHHLQHLRNVFQGRREQMIGKTFTLPESRDRLGEIFLALAPGDSAQIVLLYNTRENCIFANESEILMHI